MKLKNILYNFKFKVTHFYGKFVVEFHQHELVDGIKVELKLLF